MFGTQEVTQAIAHCMGYPNLAIGNAHSTRIRCHHQFVITNSCPFSSGYKNILAKLQGFLSITFAELVQVGTLQAFDTMDITIHPRIKALIGGRIFCKIRIKHNLIEGRKIGIHPQFFAGARQYGCPGNFCAGTAEGRNAGLINSGIFDQVPALVICRRTGIIHHQGNSFCQVHGTAAPNSDDTANGTKLLLE